MVSTVTCDNRVRGVLGIQAVRVKLVCTRWKYSGIVRGVASERFDSLSRKITCGAVYSDLSTPLSLPLSTMTYLDHTSVDTVIYRFRSTNVPSQSIQVDPRSIGKLFLLQGKLIHCGPY